MEPIVASELQADRRPQRMIIEVRVQRPDAGSSRGNQEGVGRRRGPRAYVDAVLAVPVPVVQVFKAQAHVIGQHDLGAAAGLPSPDVLAVIHLREAVGGVACAERVIDLRIAAAARRVEESAAARREACSGTQGECVIEVTTDRVAGWRGAEARREIARIVARYFEQAANNEVAVADIKTDAAAIFDAVAVLGTPGGRSSAIGSAIAETGRKRIRARGGRDRIAERAVAVGIEHEGVGPVVTLRSDSRDARYVEAVKVAIAILRGCGRCGSGRDRSHGDQHFEFHGS